MKKAMGNALFCAVGICVFFAVNVHAELMVESTRIESASPEIDGDLSDWTGGKNESNTGSFIRLDGTEIVSTIEDWDNDKDFSANIAFVHNEQALYFAATINDQIIVNDQQSRMSEDHVELRFALTKGSRGEFQQFAVGIYSNPLSNKIEVRALRNRKNRVGAIIPEIKAAIRGGANNSYSIEVAIPWSVLPIGAAKLAGMRGAVYLVDCDESNSALEDTVLSTASILGRDDPDKLPLFGLSDVTRPLDNFWKRMGLPSGSSARFFAVLDLVAGSEMEQVAVAGQYLMAFGSDINNEEKYTFIPLPITSQEQVTRFVYFDATGDAKKDLLLEFEVKQGISTKRWIAIYRLDENLKFHRVVSVPTLVASSFSHVENNLLFVKGPSRSTSIKVTSGKIQGVYQEAGEQIPELDGNRMVVPWDEPASVTYTYSSGQYVRGM